MLFSTFSEISQKKFFAEYVRGNYFSLSEPTISGVLQKIISNFEGQYPTFSFNKNHQKHTNITP